MTNLGGTGVSENTDFDDEITALFDRQDRLNPATLAAWQADPRAKLNDVVTTAERTAGNGGGGTGAIIASGTENGFEIVKHNTLPLSFSLRIKGGIVGFQSLGGVGGASAAASANNALVLARALVIVKTTLNINTVDFAAEHFIYDGPIVASGDFGATGFSFKGEKATLESTNNGVGFQVGLLSDPASEFRMRFVSDGLSYFGPGESLAASRAFHIQDTAEVNLKNGFIRFAAIGLSGDGALICEFEDLTIRDCTALYDFTATALFKPNSLFFKKVKFLKGTDRVGNIDTFPNGIVGYDSCQFEDNAPAGTSADGKTVLTFSDAGEVNFTSCHFEANKSQYGIVYNGSTEGKTITFTSCQNIAGTGTIVRIDQGYCNVFGGRLTGGITEDLRLNSATAHAFIAGCETSVTGFPGNAIWASRDGFKVGSLNNTEALGKYHAENYDNDIFTSSRNDVAILRYEKTDGTLAQTHILNSTASSSYNHSLSFGWEWKTGGFSQLNVGRSGAATVEPGEDGNISLGSGALFWKEIFAVAGTINQSDARYKTEVRKFTGDEVEAAKALSKEIGVYQWLESVKDKGENARYHIGMTVQRAIEIMESFNLDPFKYGFICYDEWDEIPATPPKQDKEGNIIHKGSEVILAGNRYSFRVGQLNMFMMRGLESRLAAAGL